MKRRKTFWCSSFSDSDKLHPKRCTIAACGVPALALIFALYTVGIPLSGHAVELASGDVDANLDVTLTYGLTARTSKRQNNLSGTNSDDGNKNYKRGIVSNTAAITTELEIQQDEFGFFTRAHGFLDYENQKGNRVRTPLSEDAKNIAGKDIKVLDAYVYGGFDLQGRLLDVRLGSQVLNWGESTFIQNGINVINPFDVSRLRTPGSELRDALVPVPMISASMDVTPNLTVEGFYQFDWKKTEIDPVGTYYSTNDYVGAGGRYAYLTIDPTITDRGRSLGLLADAINANPILGPALGDYRLKMHDPHFLAVERASDNEAKDEGQWGVAFRYFAEELNDTEFGLYFIRNHSQFPVASGRVTSSENFKIIEKMEEDITDPQRLSVLVPMLRPVMLIRGLDPTNAEESREFAEAFIQGLLVDRFAKTSNYFVEYPEDITTIGLSFNTALVNSGWALQGEYSHHSDVPLQIEEQSLFTKALLPLCQLSTDPDSRCPPGIDPNAILGKGNQQGYLQGYVRRDISQLQITATKIFGSVLGSDSTGFVGEIGVAHVHNMPDPKIIPLETGGAGDGFAGATSYGYRGALWFDYNNAIGAVKLSPYFQFLHDVNGTTPAPGGAFQDGRKVYTIGLAANYLDRWTADISYTAHSGPNNSLRDRDFLSMSISYSF